LKTYRDPPLALTKWPCDDVSSANTIHTHARRCFPLTSWSSRVACWTDGHGAHRARVFAVIFCFRSRRFRVCPADRVARVRFSHVDVNETCRETIRVSAFHLVRREVQPCVVTRRHNPLCTSSSSSVYVRERVIKTETEKKLWTKTSRTIHTVVIRWRRDKSQTGSPWKRAAAHHSRPSGKCHGRIRRVGAASRRMIPPPPPAYDVQIWACACVSRP